MAELTNARKRRGTVRSSITRQTNRLKKLEDKPDLPNALEGAKQIIERLEALDSQFRTTHFEVINLIDDETVLDREQAVLDKAEDDLADLSLRTHRLTCSLESPVVNRCRVATRMLSKLEAMVRSTKDILDKLPPDAGDLALVQQHSEKLIDGKG